LANLQFDLAVRLLGDSEGGAVSGVEWAEFQAAVPGRVTHNLGLQSDAPGVHERARGTKACFQVLSESEPAKSGLLEIVAKAPHLMRPTLIQLALDVQGFEREVGKRLGERL